MAISFDDLVDEIKTLNVASVAIVDASTIKYSKTFRQLCEQNKCGSYNKNWMCPPGVGPLVELVKKASQYKKALVFQTVHGITKSFDFKGMFEAARTHEGVLREVLALFTRRAGIKDVLPLGVGPCKVCPKCTYEDGEKCRLPDQALPSLEAFGMDVAALLKACGNPYHHGKNTVSYVGCILFTE